MELIVQLLIALGILIGGEYNSQEVKDAIQENKETIHDAGDEYHGILNWEETEG